MSYSRNSSLSGWKKPIVSWPSVELVPARPKNRDSPRPPTGTGVEQDAVQAGNQLEQFAHPFRVGAQVRGVAARLFREEEIQRDRFVDAGEDLLRARCDRIQAVLRQVETNPSQCKAAQDRHCHEGDRERDEGGCTQGSAGAGIGGGRGWGVGVHGNHVNPPSSCRARSRWRRAMRRSGRRKTPGP